MKSITAGESSTKRGRGLTWIIGKVEREGRRDDAKPLQSEAVTVWKLTPPTHLYYTGIFKGGGKDPLAYKSYRKIGLLPYSIKVDQGCIAYRESVCADIDEATSSEAASMDT